MARRSTEASTRSAWMVCAYLLLVFISPFLLVGSVRAQDAPQEPLGDKAVTGPSTLPFCVYIIPSNIVQS